MKRVTMFGIGVATALLILSGCSEKVGTEAEASKNEQKENPMTERELPALENDATAYNGRDLENVPVHLMSSEQYADKVVYSAMLSGEHEHKANQITIVTELENEDSPIYETPTYANVTGVVNTKYDLEEKHNKYAIIVASEIRTGDAIEVLDNALKEVEYKEKDNFTKENEEIVITLTKQVIGERFVRFYYEEEMLGFMGWGHEARLEVDGQVISQTEHSIVETMSLANSMGFLHNNEERAYIFDAYDTSKEATLIIYPKDEDHFRAPEPLSFVIPIVNK